MNLPDERVTPTDGVGGASSDSLLTLARAWRHPLAVGLWFGLAGLALLLIGLSRPPTMFFDEPYFVPEARALVQGVPNPAPFVSPLAKPPMAKMMIALGMELAGDNAFGWRIAGGVCGALTLVATFFWAYALLRDVGLASLAAALALLNCFLFVMSRIATADAFLLFFLMWGLAAYTAAMSLEMSARMRRLCLCAAGVLLGFAGACKWNAIDTLAVFFLISFGLLLMGPRWQTTGGSLARYVSNVKQIGLPTLGIGLIAAPLVSYSATFWALSRVTHTPFGLRQLAAINAFMWHFNKTTTVNPFIISAWYSWPLNLQPQRVLSYLVANPVVSWGGLAALAACLWRLWKGISFPEASVVLLFAANYLQWAVTPQKGLYYYYYYPCVMILGVAIAVALRSMPDRVFGVRPALVVLCAAAIVFARSYGQMAHLEAPWDCIFGCVY